MPKETFLKLSKEKQQKVVNSAKKEFARVPIQEVSIKNIVEDAGIARGSFYQYFEDKEDLLEFIVRETTEEINKALERKIKEQNGDLFNIYICMYDSMIENFVKNDEKKLFKQIFENIKSSEEIKFKILKENGKPKDVSDFYDLIDKSNLKIENQDDFITITRMLNMITRKAIIMSLKNEAIQETREEFLKQINYLKFGVQKSYGISHP